MRRPAAIIALLALAACSRPSNRETPSKPLSRVPSESEQISLQLAADQACNCVRSGGKHVACWKSFDQRVRPYGPRDEMAAGMYPVSITNICFGDSTSPKSGFCINTFYMPGHDDLDVCSVAEACALANAYSAYDTAASHAQVRDGVDPGDATVTALARRFAAGEKPRPTKVCKL